MKYSYKKPLLITTVVIFLIYIIYYALSPIWHQSGVTELSPSEFKKYPQLATFLEDIQKAVKSGNYYDLPSLKLKPEGDPEYDKLLLKILIACIKTKDSFLTKFNDAVIISDIQSVDDIIYYCKSLKKANPSLQIKEKGAAILGKMGRRAAPALDELFKCFQAAEDPSTRNLILEVIPEIAGEKLLPFTVKALTSSKELYLWSFFIIADNGEMYSDNANELFLKSPLYTEEYFEEQEAYDLLNAKCGVFYSITGMIAESISPEKFFNLLQNKNRNVRAAAAASSATYLISGENMSEYVVMTQSEKCTFLLNKLLDVLENDPDPFVRVCAAHSIGSFNLQSYKPLLKKMHITDRLVKIYKKEHHPAVRTELLTVLKPNINNYFDLYYNVLTEKKEDVFVKSAAAQAFAELCDNRRKALEKHTGRFLLKIAMNSDNPLCLRNAAFSGAAGCGSPETEEKVIDFLKKKQKTKLIEYHYGGNVLPLLRSEASVIFLKSMFKDLRYNGKREFILQALAANDSPSAVSAIIDFMDEIRKDNEFKERIGYIFCTPPQSRTALKILKIYRKSNPVLALKLAYKWRRGLLLSYD